MTKKTPSKTTPKKADSEKKASASPTDAKTNASDSTKENGFPLFTLLAATAIVAATYIGTKNINKNSVLEPASETAENVEKPAARTELSNETETRLNEEDLDSILASKSSKPSTAYVPNIAPQPITAAPIQDELEEDHEEMVELLEDITNDEAFSDVQSARLKQKISNLSRKVKTLKTENRSLKKELRTLKNLQQETKLHASVTGLHYAITNGSNYEAALQQLSTLDDTPLEISRAVAKLDALPTHQVMKLEHLGKRLVETARDYQHSAATDEDASLWKKTMNNLTSSIHIRKVGGNHEGDDDEAIIARAEAQLDSGDIEAALGELENLSPDAADFFANWTTMAQEHLTAIQAANTMLSTLNKGGAS